MRRFLFLSTIFLGIVGVTATFFTSDTRNIASVIFSQDTTLTDCLQDIALSKQNKSIDTYRVQREPVNVDSQADIIIQDTSANACGSVGCIYDICLVDKGESNRIPFGFAAQTLTITDSISEGMHDIILEFNEKEKTLLQWDGERYRPQLQ